MPKLRSRPYAYFVLSLNALLWGIAAPIIKYSLQFTTPATFLFYRYIVATIIFLPIFLIYRSKHRFSIHHTSTVLLALMGGPICLLLSFYGINQTTSLEASIIGATSPVFTIVACLILLNETLRVREWRGLFLAILGTLIIALEPLITGHNHIQLSVEGNFLIVLSNVTWTIFLLLSKKLKADPIYVSFYSFIISIPFFFILTTLTPNSNLNLSPSAFPGVLFMGLGGSVIGFWAYQEGQKRIEASEAAIFTYLQPVFAIPLAIVWLKEAFSPVAIIATLIIAIGVYISEKR
jgi:drug/metabolite transporter (DMT)-like permease